MRPPTLGAVADDDGQSLTTDQRMALVLRAVQRLEGRVETVTETVDVQLDELREALDERTAATVALVEAVKGLRSDLLTAVGELRAEREQRHTDLLAAVGVDPAVDRLAAAVSEVAEELEHVLEDRESLRADVRREVERVLGALGSTERAVTGEVRSLDGRVAAVADDMRTVRNLPAELQRDLGGLLAELAGGRTLEAGRGQGEVVEVAAAPRVEAALADIGRRLDRLADSVEARSPEPPPATTVTGGLRRLAARALQPPAR